MRKAKMNFFLLSGNLPKFMVATAFMLTATVSNAQISLGFQLGPSMNTFTSDQFHTGSIFGANGGIFIYEPFSSKLELKTGAEYLLNGGRLLTFYDDTRYGNTTQPFAVRTVDSKVYIHSLNIPVLLKYNYISNGNAKASINIGPEVSYNFYALSLETVTSPNGDGTYVTFSQSNIVINNYESFVFGASAGLGFEIPAGNNAITFETRFRMGITKIRSNYSYLTTPYIMGDVYAHSLILSIGYHFGGQQNNSSQ